MSQLNFFWRCQPRSGSKMFLAIKYLQSQPTENRSKLIQKALEAYYYPLAYQTSDLTRKKQVGYESILNLMAQIEEICLICGISSRAKQQLLSSYFLDKDTTWEKTKVIETKPEIIVNDETFDINLVSFDNFMIKREFK